MTESVDQRRYRTKVGYTLMAYKTILGAAEVSAAIALSVPALDPIRRFRAWAAAEQRADPNDLVAGLIARHMPSFLPHRPVIVAGLLALGVLKITAAVAMFNGYEWGPILLLAVVALALPLEVRATIVHPSTEHVLFAAVNVVAIVALAAIIRARLARPADGATG